MQLRDYQQSSVDAVYSHLRSRDDNPCLVVPTGGGKTPIMATICRDAVEQWGGRVLILAHVKELLEQAAATLRRVAPGLGVGVYSAGLNSRDTAEPVIVAGIQSVFRRACDLGSFDLILVDEAHLLPPDGEGMYQEFLADAKIINPNIRIIGLTATPYRLKSGTICEPGNLLNHVCYEVGVKELINRGFLSPLVTRGGTTKPGFEGLHIRAGEFIASEMSDLMDTDELVNAACGEIVELTTDRKSVILFCSSVAHAKHVASKLSELTGEKCGAIFGKTPAAARAETIERFKSGGIKYLVNVAVLTTGFDAPNVDCVCLLRPTASPGLYYQMVGRGFRLAEGKSDCLVLDYGGNILRHGPVDAIKVKPGNSSKGGEAPAKECPECKLIVAAGYSKCPECGFTFPIAETKHGERASEEKIVSVVTEEVAEVLDATYSLHHKKNGKPDDPRTMRVTYRIGFSSYLSEWICFEHQGYARNKAITWWTERSNDPVPIDSERAAWLCSECGVLAETKSLTLRSKTGDEWPEIVGYELGELPEALEEMPEQDNGINEEDIPF